MSVAALRAKRAAAEGQCHVDVGFWGGAVPGNIGELTMLHEAGDTALAVLLNGQPVKGQPAGHEQP